MIWVAGIWLTINLVTYFSYGIDKRRARQGRWRVSEATLLSLSAGGGALGAWRAMKDFRHKTRNRRFALFIPMLMTLQAALLCWIALRWSEPNGDTIIASLSILLTHLVAMWRRKGK